MWSAVIAGLALVTAAPNALGQGDAPAASDARALPLDPAIVTHRLENGVEIVIRPVAESRDEVSMVLVIRSGTLAESDEQRGASVLLAHGATLLPSCKSIIEQGLAPEREVLARASYDRSVFGVTIGSSEMPAIEKGLDWLADVARAGAAEASMLEPARALLIEREMAAAGASIRLSRQALPMMAPGSRLAARAPYAIAGEAAELTADNIIAFAGAWYAPARMTVIVTGEVDAFAMVKGVSARFAGLVGPANAAAEPDAGLATLGDMSAAGLSDPELSGDFFQVTRLSTINEPVTTERTLTAELLQWVAMTALERQLTIRANHSDENVLDVQTMVIEPVRGVRMAIVAASTPAGYWDQAAGILGEEFGRVLRDGLAPQSVEWAARTVLARLADAATGERSADARSVAARLADESARGRRLFSPEQSLTVARRVIPGFTPEQVSAALLECCDFRRSIVLASVPAGAPPSAERVVGSLRDAMDRRPAPLPDTPVVVDMLQVEPGAGRVVMLEPAPELPSAVSAWLDNGVRFHHAEMRTRPGRIAVAITIAGGRIEETIATRGLTDAAEILWKSPAAESRESSQLESLLSGRSIRLDGTIEDDAVHLTIECAKEDAETAMELAHLLLREPVLERSSFRKWRHRALLDARDASLSPKSAANMAFQSAMAPEGDPRSRPLAPSDIESIERHNAQVWVRSLVTRAPLEAAITGDITRAEAIVLGSKYLGTLPARARVDDTPFAALRHVRDPVEFISKVRVEGPTPHAVVVGGFRIQETCSPRDEIIMEMAARILSLRLGKSVRGASRLASSVHAASLTRCAYPGYGIFWADSVCDPANADAIAAIMESSFREFAADGPTPEELDAAKRLTLHAIKTRMEDPAWWADELSQLTYRARRHADLVSARAIVSGMSISELRDGFAAAFHDGQRVRVTTAPATDPTATDRGTASISP